MKTKDVKRVWIIMISLLAVLLLSGGILWEFRHGRSKQINEQHAHSANTTIPSQPADPLRPARDAYTAGKYKDAESLAKDKSEQAHKNVARARYILAFSAARRNDLRLARDRFAVLKKEAARLPDRGAKEPKPGIVSPTLEEDGAYQHAVCTATLGDKVAAEAEYMQFMRDYPDSPLIDAAARRIERLHDGHLPPQAEVLWTKANKIAREREKAREKERRLALAMCGPACLAELLRRQGEHADTRLLASEMGTNEQGTSLEALAKAAKKRGMQAQGFSLTQCGLSKQHLPVIVLLTPGHYVLVDEVTSDHVTVWDPFGKGIGEPGVHQYPMKDWSRMWTGIALTFQ